MDMHWHDLHNAENQYARESRMSLRDVLNILFKHKGKIAVFFMATVLAAALYVFLSPSRYVSESKLLIKVGRAASLDPSVVGPIFPIAQQRENEVNSEVAILKSRIIAERIVDEIGPDYFMSAEPETESGTRLSRSLEVLRAGLGAVKSGVKNMMIATGLATELSPREQAVMRLLENLGVEPVEDSNILKVSMQETAPETARRVLAKVLDAYQEHHIEVHRSQAPPDFFEAQSARMLERIQAKEKELEDYRTQHGIGSVLEQKNEVIAQIGSVQRELDTLGSRMEGSRARIAAFNQILHKNPIEPVELNRTEGKTNYYADALREEWMKLKVQETQLASRYSDNNKNLKDLREQIKLLESMMRQANATHTEVTSGIDSNQKSLQHLLNLEQSDLEAMKDQEKYLLGVMEARRNELNEWTRREFVIKQLQRELDALNSEYNEFLNKYQRAKVNAALDESKVSNVSIVQPPTLPFEAAAPKKLLILLIALVAGSLGGVLIAMAKNYFDDSLQTNEDIQQRLGLPVLSAMSYNATGQTADERLMVMYHNLNLMFPSEKGRIVQFISANRGEGTTTLVKELARVAAEKFHNQVLWVTMEPGLAEEPSRNGKKGPSGTPPADLLRGGILPLGENGVHVSSLRVQPSLGMIDSRVFAQTLAALREEYDLVLIDSPAASMSAYGMTLSRNFDGVVLVVEAEKTRWQATAHLRDMILHKGGNVLGVILNKQRFHIPQLIYERLL
ncbi:MAG: GumC family protein [bacterium]